MGSYDLPPRNRGGFLLTNYVFRVKRERRFKMRIGNRFLLEDSQYKGLYDEYILALVDSTENKIQLINLKEGNPWRSPPIKVKNPFSISQEEFNLLREDFKLIKIRR